MTLPRLPTTVSSSSSLHRKDGNSKATGADFAMLSVHQTAWFGSVTASTTGNGKQAGATRTFTQGPYSFVEELYQFKQKGCGDFTMKYIQHDGKPPRFFSLALAIAAKSQF